MTNVILTVVTTFVLTAAIVWMFQKLKASERELSTLKKLNEQHLSVEDVQSICSRNLKRYISTQEDNKTTNKTKLSPNAAASTASQHQPDEKEKRKKRDNTEQQKESNKTKETSETISSETVAVD